MQTLDLLWKQPVRAKETLANNPVTVFPGVGPEEVKSNVHTKTCMQQLFFSLFFF